MRYCEAHIFDGIKGKSYSLTTSFLWLMLIAGLILSIMSALNICHTACSAVSEYKIFGLNFGWFGVIFFLALMAILALPARFVLAANLFMIMVYAAAGAELRFIWLQKYIIGKWCPLCLLIAAVIYSIAIITLSEKWKSIRLQGQNMRTYLKHAALIIITMTMGLSGAILGVQKEANAAELNLYLGKTDSQTVVYFISDWFCPACRRTEPAVAVMYPKLAAIAKLGFVDIPVHPETSNFTPYHLQFLVYEKAKYIQLRKALDDVSRKTKTPSPEDIQKAIAPLGVKLRTMSYAAIASGMDWNEAIFKKYEIKATPTVVVSNLKTGKHVSLVGEKEINYQSIFNAINETGK